MVAISGHRIVLINQSRFERKGWPWRVALLAHELGHVLQYELGGGKRGTPAHWLFEGFAEWVKMRVMEALGRDDAAEARWRAMVRVRTHTQVRRGVVSSLGAHTNWLEQHYASKLVPPLAALASSGDWIEQSHANCGVILYDYSFIATALLLEQHGAPAVMRYFELSAEHHDAAANFLEAFGEPEEQFDTRLRRSVWP
jgi:hypothetical protein